MKRFNKKLIKLISSFRTPEALSQSRKRVTKSSILQWFTSAREFFGEADAADILQDPTRNFNLDESGFSLSPATGQVLAIRGSQNVSGTTSSKAKENITVLACVSADGQVPPPMIIYPRKRISEAIIENSRGEDFIIGKSDSGYIITECFYEYMCNGFNDWLEANDIKKPVVVWTDWHETRINFHLAKTLQDLQIILYGLPPNSTHFMQPLDVSVFGPMKKAWRTAAADWQESHPDETLTQAYFATVFLPMYKKACKKENILNGFRKCGLHPFDPEAPDYSKITTEAMKACATVLFDGIDQGGIVEKGTQTDFHTPVHTGVQTDSSQESRFQQELKEAECVESMYNTIQSSKHCRATACDLALTDKVKRFLLQKKAKVNFRLPSKETFLSPNMKNKPKQGSTISAAFKGYKWFPSPRKTQGPKYKKTIRDKTFALSSSAAVQLLEKERNAKQALELKKRSKDSKLPKKGKSAQTSEPVTASTSVNTLTEENEDSSSDESLEASMVPLEDSDDDSIGVETIATENALQFIDLQQQPEQGSWVMVKLPVIHSTFKGRKTVTHKACLGRIERVAEEGLEVHFLKELEAKKDHFVWGSSDDFSFPVTPDEVCVIQNKCVTDVIQGRTATIKVENGVVAAGKSCLGII